MKKSVTIPQFFLGLLPVFISGLLVGFFCSGALAASVSVCNLENMRPYIQSGLREYAAATLYENNFKTYPKDVQVTYGGQVPVYQSNELTTEDGFDVKVAMQDGDQMVVFTSSSGGPKWLMIPPPIVEKQFDQDGHLLGDKCVVYLGASRERINYFENAKSGVTVLKDTVSQASSMLCWVAIKK